MSERPAHWEARLPFFYGWAVVGACFVTHFVQVGIQLWALSVFVGPMTGELGWERSDIFGAVTVRTLIAAFGLPLVGRYLDRRNGAVVLSAFASALGAVSLLLTAHVSEPLHFMLAYGVLGGVANVGQTVVIAAAIVPKWFVRRRGIAMAVGTTGGGAGALVLPLVAAALVGALGWRDAWTVFGVATAVIAVPLALALKRQPEDVGLEPDGARTPAGAPRAGIEGVTAGQAARMPVTWLLVSAVGLASLASVGLPANMVPLMADRGFSQTGGALALSVYGLMSVTGRYVWGYAVARLGVRGAFMALVAFATVVMGGLLLVRSGTAPLLVLAGASGLAIGGMIVLAPLVWPAYLGRAHLGAIHGFLYPINAVSLAAGPVLLSEVFDRTGSYDWGIGALAAAYALALGVMALAGPPHRST